MEKKRGRPPKGEVAQKARIYLRAEDADKAILEEAAAKAKMTLSDWIRDRLMNTALRELKRYT